MNTEIESDIDNPDPAAIFAAAHSLWEACEKSARSDRLDLSECYRGMDQLMRVVMRIATQFEVWACEHIDFKSFSLAWPYYLEDGFGDACLAVVLLTELESFNESDCLRVALYLRLPVFIDDTLPVPVSVNANNPVGDAPFRTFRIQTVRDLIDDQDVVPFTFDDDPFDDNFGKPYFALYGVCEDGKLEHIADRGTYEETVELIRKIAPEVEFTEQRHEHE